MSAGWCAWHRDRAEDVEPIFYEERGSGPAAAISVCLPCARKMHGRPYGEAGRAAVKALEGRAAESRSRPRA
ncbi:hypothetical protein FM076_02465 [Streptomyces albus subsp. chlorinus]|uniref:hypothetical protein n=1 Tax=Streptomyces albus TaxID=1888 RepID=UPI0015704465|nr:hypothetical protein [Streptomyces albus]NSC20132.1 hypothetical protein [Streptomyces albus subsp. chlorinus]